MTDRNTSAASSSSTVPSPAAPGGLPPTAHSASDSRRQEGHYSSPRQGPEKVSATIDPYASPLPIRPVSTNVIRISYSDDPELEEEELGCKALRILIYLGGPCFFISLLTLLYTFISLLLSLLMAPLHSCKIGGDMNCLLGPATRMHLRLISSAAPNTDIKISTMALVLFLSPLAAVGVALASWTAAVFWFYVSILGNPDGKDRYNDGRATVLAVRAWWEKWLLRSFDEEGPQMVETRSHQGNRAG